MRYSYRKFSVYLIPISFKMKQEENKVSKHKRKIAFDPNHPIDASVVSQKALYSIYEFDEKRINYYTLNSKGGALDVATIPHLFWLNADGLNQLEVEAICSELKIHPLLVEDILSIGQRAKMDEVENRILCQLPMIYFNEENKTIETEQLSIIIGDHFVISFQEDDSRDVFSSLRSRLNMNHAKIIERGADYLAHALIDVVVDSYYTVIDKLGDMVYELEDRLIANKVKFLLADISHVRKEIMIMKRSIGPVRELVNGLLRTDNPLIKDRNDKYFKDVLDHIIQANENCDSIRDIANNTQDMYMNSINLRMNQVMKLFTMVSLLLAPATVIGGIFGMNFENLPLLHDQRGFYISVIAMLAIPALMLAYFKKKKWF
jgi:magnesium transporter